MPERHIVAHRHHEDSSDNHHGSSQSGRSSQSLTVARARPALLSWGDALIVCGGFRSAWRRGAQVRRWLGSRCTHRYGFAEFFQNTFSIAVWLLLETYARATPMTLG